MSRKLYVGNLSYSTVETDLQNLFASVGPVDSVRVITDRETGRSKGFGFIEMSEDAAERAIQQFNGQPFMGRTLNVSDAKPQAPRTTRGYRPERSQTGGNW